MGSAYKLHWLGVDVGWVFPAADSDGKVYPWTTRRSPTITLAQAGPVTIRKPDGRTIVAPAYTPARAVTALARGERACYRGVAHQIVTSAARTNRRIALEDWMDFARRKTAWVGMWATIAMIAEARGVEVTQVNRAYTSITCPVCGHKDRGNRENRDRFRCLGCGFNGHADVIAAMNIAAKAAGEFRVADRTCTNPACDGGVVWAAGFCIPCYNFNRRHGRPPSVEDVEVRRNAPSVQQYRRARHKQLLQERQERREAVAQERMWESYRTHDAWGNPLDAVGE